MRTLAALLCVLALTGLGYGQSGGLVNATRGFPAPNDGATGTTLNGTAKIQANGTAIVAGTGDTAVATYIVIGGAGKSSNAVLASLGSIAPCTMDSTIASGAGGYYVVNSTTTAQECHAQVAPPAAGVWVLGYLWDQATTTGQTARVIVSWYLSAGAGGTGSITQSVPPELLVNGAASATGSNLAITKAGEVPLESWLSPASNALGNILHSNSSSCATSTACTVTVQITGSTDGIVLTIDPDGAPGAVTITDTFGNTYTSVGAFADVVCSSLSSGSDVIHLSSANSVGWIMSAADITGNATSSCVDTAITNGGTSTSITSSGSVSQSSELIFGYFNNIGSLGSGLASYQAGTGYTQVEQVNCTVPNCARIAQILEVGNQNASLSGTQTATTTRIGGLTDGSEIFAIKLTTASVNGPPAFRQITWNYLPVATQTPTNGDCLDVLVQVKGNVFGDSGFPCAPAYASGSTSATAPSALGCNDTTVSFTPASVGQAVLVTPQTSPGANVSWSGFVSASNQVDIRLCTLVAFTPSAVTYQIRVFQ